jgi:hypothetical protein
MGVISAHRMHHLGLITKSHHGMHVGPRFISLAQTGVVEAGLWDLDLHLTPFPCWVFDARRRYALTLGFGSSVVLV